MVCAAVYALQARLVYYPAPVLKRDPSNAELEFRDVHLRTGDGVDLHGWFLPCEGATRAALFFHGNAGNLGDRIETLATLHALGLAVLAIDYRGYGRSGGHPHERGLHADARAAWDHLRDHEGFASREIILFGRSLGGAVAVELAHRVNPGALVVEASFTSALDLGARAYPWLPVRRLSRHRYESVKLVGTLAMPKLFIHSRHDDVVPFAMGRALYQEAAEPKRFLEIEGGHADGFLVTGSRYLLAWRAFLQSLDG